MASERARLAELQVEAQFLEQQQLMEQESKAFKLNLEIAKARAKIEVYKCIEEEEQEQEQEQDQMLGQLCEDVDKNQYVSNYVMSHHIPNHENKSLKNQRRIKWRLVHSKQGKRFQISLMVLGDSMR